MRTAVSLCLLAASAAQAAVTKPPQGFVTTEGIKFKLDGKDFFFAGSNAYYFPFNNVSERLNLVRAMSALECDGSLTAGSEPN